MSVFSYTVMSVFSYTVMSVFSYTVSFFEAISKPLWRILLSRSMQDFFETGQTSTLSLKCSLSISISFTNHQLSCTDDKTWCAFL